MKKYIKTARNKLTIKQRAEIARTSDDLDTLSKLANDDNIHVRCGVALNPNTPTRLMIELLSGADADDWRIPGSLAENVNAPLEILSQLADDRRWLVRARVAANPNISSKLMMQLAHDKDIDVRWGLIKNPNISLEALQQLASDPDPHIRSRAEYLMD